MILPNIYIDLDGVLADFDAHFPEVFGISHKEMADSKMWDPISAHPSYFLDMPPCPGAIEFFRKVDEEPLKPIILTACPKTNYRNAALQKREWVRTHLGSHVPVLPVMGGHNKGLFMHAEGDILIDDFIRNIDEWRKFGGVGIMHTYNAWELTEYELKRELNVRMLV